MPHGPGQVATSTSVAAPWAGDRNTPNPMNTVLKFLAAVLLLAILFGIVAPISIHLWVDWYNIGHVLK